MKYCHLMYVLLFFFPSVSASVVITEIMYNPIGTDNGFEWIEIYSNASPNLSGWKLFENNIDHSIILINGSWLLYGYGIIADDVEKFLQIYPSFNGTLFKSSFSLKNTQGDFIALKDSALQVIDAINYSALWGGEDNSLEKIEIFSSQTDKNWASSLLHNGTPGKENSLLGTCDWKISLLLDKEIWEINPKDAEIRWKIEVQEDKNNTQAFFTYWIEDPSGVIIKEKVEKNTTATSVFGPFRKTFSQSGGYLLRANITNTTCFDHNPQNNFITKPLIITGVEGNTVSSIKESSLAILDVSPSSPQFGDTLKVKIALYRGDTRKYTVSAYVENSKGKKVSEKTSLNLENKFTNYTLTIPLLLKESCDYDSDTYDLIIEGLEVAEKKKIEIKSLSCSEDTEKKSVSKKTASLEVLNIIPSLNERNTVLASLKINNPGSEHNYKVWGYVYRGKKCYSCNHETSSRDADSKILNLNPNSDKNFDMMFHLDDNLEGGEYKLKVSLQRLDQKTAQEIITPLYLPSFVQEKEKKLPRAVSTTASSKKTQNNFLESSFSKQDQYRKKELLPFLKGMVIYESNTEKTRKSLPYILIITFVLLTILILFKKK